MGPVDKHKKEIKKDFKHQKREVAKAIKIVEDLMVKLEEIEDRLEMTEVFLEGIPARAMDAAIYVIKRRKDPQQFRAQLEVLAHQINCIKGTRDHLPQSFKLPRKMVGQGNKSIAQRQTCRRVVPQTVTKCQTVSKPASYKLLSAVNGSTISTMTSIRNVVPRPKSPVPPYAKSMDCLNSTYRGSTVSRPNSVSRENPASRSKCIPSESEASRSISVPCQNSVSSAENVACKPQEDDDDGDGDEDMEE